VVELRRLVRDNEADAVVRTLGRISSKRGGIHHRYLPEGCWIRLGVNGGVLVMPAADLARITHDPAVMGGRPCIRGLRVTVGTIVGLLAAGHSADEILKAYPYLEADDIQAALSYAAWRAESVRC
jgi:uncharacterized protein (DUF433 family)